MPDDDDVRVFHRIFSVEIIIIIATVSWMWTVG